MNKLILSVCLSTFLGFVPLAMAETNTTDGGTLDNIFGMDDVIDQGDNDGGVFDGGSLAYYGIDPPTDPDGVPVDGGILTVIGGALFYGARQLRQKRNDGGSC